MNALNVKRYKRPVLAITLVLALLIVLLIKSPAAGQYRSTDLSVPAEKPAALQLIQSNGASQSPKQPPGLVGKPQNHLAPPETAPPNNAPPDSVPPSEPQPGEIPPVPPAPGIKPKIPVCPEYVQGSDTTYFDNHCGCRQPLTPGDSYVCAIP
ncbi:MAG TPA: hypothetical protein VFW52_00045 [Candidatus Saccharimonadales bacterium]|nr:hypothetical protein [Candidatus Saccharimonadales bacterium]